VSSLLGEAGSFLDKYLIGYALGTASGPALAPFVQDLANEAWTLNPVVPPDAVLLAQGVAQGQVAKSTAYAWAKETGFDKAQMDALVNIANVGPALGYAFEAWRRGFLNDGEFQTALNRTGLEAQWYPAMKQLKTRLVDLPTLANGIQRGLIASPFALPYDAQPPAGQIQPFPTVGIDAAATAEGLGYTVEELQLEVGLAGNPPGPEALYRAWFRGAIDANDVQRGLVEGRARGEWAKAFEADARQIPTVHEFVENAIRGYSQLSDAIAGGQRHGMTPEDVTLIYQNAGRPLTPHQITIGLARGAAFHPIPGEIPDPYEASAHEASVKPSYQELYIAAGKYGYPSLFQLNALVKANAITADIAKDWATKSGLAPEVVDALGQFWAGESSGTAGGPKPKTYTYSQIHQAWRHGVFTDAQALQELQDIGYSAARAQTLLNTWKATPASGA
jgi:hypothetical protein